MWSMYYCVSAFFLGFSWGGGRSRQELRFYWCIGVSHFKTLLNVLSIALFADNSRGVHGIAKMHVFCRV